MSTNHSSVGVCPVRLSPQYPLFKINACIIHCNKVGQPSNRRTIVFRNIDPGIIKTIGDAYDSYLGTSSRHEKWRGTPLLTFEHL